VRLRPLLSLLPFCLGALLLPAQVVISGFTQTGSLPANDDDYSSAVSLGFTLNFGGVSYSQTYVSNNGYITFGQGSGDYSPSALNSQYSGDPIIAAFFSDVDTRSPNNGTVTWGTGTVDGKAAFAVKWNQVGEYPASSHPGSSNTFEIILVSRGDLGAENFDVHLNYGSMNWDHADSNEFGAVVGFHNGGNSTNQRTAVFYQVPGSGTPGAFLDNGTNSLKSSTNTGTGGLLSFSARNGGFSEIAQFVAIPEPSTWTLLALGAGLLGLGWIRRRA
jgi:hypothetical protein